ncbi:kinase-like domain-containing protein [Boeremia exigua]|uniref:kinase-like domain-containing protein n=1 Tax=Boeremia exigua TaxID=749465 RepID=UPI001E8D6894|nr:kinase-like domain-containing protein [Boeremia exigua]KAH6622316.1 kinase-like domain-containing protein [Boeremia exigua]
MTTLHFPGVDTEVPADAEGPSRTSRIDSASHTATGGTLRAKFTYNLRDVKDLAEYLVDHCGLHCFNLHSINKHSANHVYRLVGGDKDAGKTYVLKHASEHRAHDGTLAATTCRMEYEAKFLASKLKDEIECHCTAKGITTDVNAHIDKTHAQTVSLVFYDDEIKLLCMQDIGNTSLKDAYSFLSKEQVHEIGTEIGKWLARLHGETPISSVLGDSGLNNEVGIEMVRYAYKNLADLFRRTGHKAELAKDIDDYFGGRISRDRESVCHGDFSPGNIMLQSNVKTGTPCVLTVIDWEAVRVGNSATDVGQFAAEAFLLDEYHGGKGLRAAFIQAYFQSSAVHYGSKELLYPWMTKIGAHFATHLAYWPSHNGHWAYYERKKIDLVGMAALILADVVCPKPNIMVWRR